MSEATQETAVLSADRHDHYRADLDHYWERLMWYRAELWRITLPVWGVYGAFIASCIGYVWSSAGGQRISGDIALMLITVILLFSWVVHRMYRIYARRIYESIRGLNTEVQMREQYIYRHFLNPAWQSDYHRFKVYPQLDVIFSIIALCMAAACIFTVSASVGFDFGYQPPLPVGQTVPNGVPPMAITPTALLLICLVLLGLFEFTVWLIAKLDNATHLTVYRLQGALDVNLKDGAVPHGPS